MNTSSVSVLSTQRPAEEGLEVLAAATHRVRNLLMAVRGYAELISRGEGDREQWMEWARRILVQLDLLDSAHARLDAGRTAPRGGRVDLPWILRTADRRSRSRCHGDAAAIDVNLRIESDAELRADGDAVTEALSCLIDNAREATAQARRTDPIEICLSGGPEDWTIVLRDRGNGIDPEIADRIGEPFLTRKAGHFGIGVYLARTLLNRHGLELALRSAADVGSVVTIRHRPEPAGGDR